MKQYEGRLIIHTGSMFSGKTSALIEELRRFKFAKYKTLLFKPVIDKRYSETEVITHTKTNSHQAIPIKYLDEILEYDTDVYGLDEFQFYQSKRNITEILNELLDKNKIIIIAGLDIDYKGNAFENMKIVMPIADYVYKHHAICVICGEDAWISHRTSNETDRIVVGADDKYIPLCRKCYNKQR
ncbi:thymidine kinase [Caldicellulosiruptoraceae bacterium PP1]